MRDSILGGKGTARYFEEVRRFPMLKPDEEYALAARWRERGDRSAAHQLSTSHLRLVVKIAMGYRRYGVPLSDLISEGNVGLMQALERFDPDKGTRFSTYAIWWIKAAIKICSSQYFEEAQPCLRFSFSSVIHDPPTGSAPRTLSGGAVFIDPSNYRSPVAVLRSLMTSGVPHG